MIKSFKFIFALLLNAVLLMSLFEIESCSGDVSNGHLSIPNRDRDKSLERLLGLGVVLPYPYFQKPRYRFPVYDRNGRGSLFYGYGGREVYEYKSFTPIEGHH